MRGLLLLSDPLCAQIKSECCLAEAVGQDIQIQMHRAAEKHDPSLLSSLQTKLSRLTGRCDWICVVAEGRLMAHGLVLAAQLPVDRLILVGDGLFMRDADRRQRRLNAFALRNLPLITAEIIAAGMKEASLRRIAGLQSFHSGGLMALADGAQLWQMGESFLTAPFHSLANSC